MQYTGCPEEDFFFWPPQALYLTFILLNVFFTCSSVSSFCWPAFSLNVYMMGCRVFQTEDLAEFFFALKLLWHPYGVLSWWYMVIGTFRTQIWALRKPGKPKTDFQWVKIEEIWKTHFLTSNGSRINTRRPTKAPNINSERYWHGHFILRKGWPLQNESLRLQSA